jgi:hypothetical protein
MQASPSPSPSRLRSYGPIIEVHFVACLFILAVISVDVFYLIDNKNICRDELNPILRAVLSRTYEQHGVACVAALRLFTGVCALLSLDYLLARGYNALYVMLGCTYLIEQLFLLFFLFS